MLEMTELQQIFERTREAAHTFMNLIQPLNDNAQDEHTRLYYHHIFEEEEQRVDRLNVLIPALVGISQEGQAEGLSDRELSRLLSDINLERFGLHNFREHLELALYHFQDEQTRSLLNQLREMTHADYLKAKDYMLQMTEQISDTKTISVVDHDEGHAVLSVDHLKASAAAPIVLLKKGLTVGSLRTSGS